MAGPAWCSDTRVQCSYQVLMRMWPLVPFCCCDGINTINIGDIIHILVNNAVSGVMNGASGSQWPFFSKLMLHVFQIIHVQCTRYVQDIPNIIFMINRVIDTVATLCTLDLAFSSTEWTPPSPFICNNSPDNWRVVITKNYSLNTSKLFRLCATVHVPVHQPCCHDPGDALLTGSPSVTF